MNFDLVALLKSVAPTLATMLGGPLAGTAVTALQSVFGITNDSSGKDLPSALTAITTAIQNGAMTPDAIAALRAADQKHAEMLGQQGIDLVKINQAHDEAIAAGIIADRASARDMAVKGNDMWTPRLLALAVVIGWGAVQFYLIGHVVDAGMRELIARVLGTLDSALMCVLYFYFGGSAGSNRKTELMAQQAVATPATTTN